MTPKPEAELKALPCPFCESKTVGFPPQVNKTPPYVFCQCGAEGPKLAGWLGGIDEAIVAWNTRATEPASVPGDVVERVREITDMIEMFGINPIDRHERSITYNGRKVHASDLRALLAAVPVVEGKSP